MLGLGQTTAKLARYRRQWERFLAAAKTTGATAANTAPQATGLAEQTSFGTNPGNLRMLTYVPEGLTPGAPLVVVLHGCTQTAGGYDAGTGWSSLAARHGFALLLPEQKRANNHNACFTWFSAEDTTRERGEALSIRQMIESMVVAHDIDRSRIYITGLSAGGAMSAVMLATYPEVFAGGAIIAGLPYGSATSVQEAFDAMFQCQPRPAPSWGDLVRAASSHSGPWPKISVWHGTADQTVKPANADEIIKQWSDVHGLGATLPSETSLDGHRYRVWHNEKGAPVIESYMITGMGHGVPIGAGCGQAAPFILDVGISSTLRIAASWDLTAPQPAEAAAPERNAKWERRAAGKPASAIIIDQDGRVLDEAPEGANPSPAADDGANAGDRTGTPRIDPGSVITKALRAAGLMK